MRPACAARIPATTRAQPTGATTSCERDETAGHARSPPRETRSPSSGWHYRDVNFLIRVVVNALALAVACWIFDDIYVSGTGMDEVWTLLGVGVIFGLVNAIIAPVVKLLSLPFIVLTLGLLLFVINALMLLLTGWIADQIGLDFHVDGFWTAVWGAIVISIASAIFGALLDD